MTEGTIRTTALSADEKKLLTNTLDTLKLAGKSSGQVVIHLNQGAVTAVEPRLMLR